MANGDFLGMQLHDAEERAAKAKDNLKTAASQQAQKHHQDSSASRGASISTTSSPALDSQPDDSARASGNGKRKKQDWRRVNRRRRTHSLTFSDDTWQEMHAYAQRNGISVSEMLTDLWEKKGRKLFR